MKFECQLRVYWNVFANFTSQLRSIVNAVCHIGVHIDNTISAYSLWRNSLGRWKCWLYRDLRLDFNLLIIWNQFQCTAFPYRNCVKHKHKHNFGPAGNNNIAYQVEHFKIDLILTARVWCNETVYKVSWLRV